MGRAGKYCRSYNCIPSTISIWCQTWEDRESVYAYAGMTVVLALVAVCVNVVVLFQVRRWLKVVPVISFLVSLDISLLAYFVYSFRVSW